MTNVAENLEPAVTEESVLAPVIKKAKKVALAFSPEDLYNAKEMLRDVTMALCFDSNTNFYGHFLGKVNTAWTNQIHTAGVSITRQMNLLINPKFFVQLSDRERFELILHEMDHLIYLHPIVGKGLGSHQAANMAFDAHINERLTALKGMKGRTMEGFDHPFEPITYDGLDNKFSTDGNSVKKGLPAAKTVRGDLSIVNYEIILNELSDKNGKGQGGGEGEIDSHETWEESSAISEQMARDIVKQAANQSAKNAGNAPSHLQKQLEILNTSKVNWKQQLRHFFVNSLRYDFEHTRNRRNRRYGLDVAGRRKDEQLHVAVCMDSSGSVGDEQFTQFWAEMAKIHAMGVEITCIDADCEVSAVYKYDKKTPPQRHGNGGTAYGPAIKKAKELKVDGIIYFGDFDCADTPEDPKLPFLWVGVNTNSSAPGKFGKVIYVKTDK